MMLTSMHHPPSASSSSSVAAPSRAPKLRKSRHTSGNLANKHHSISSSSDDCPGISSSPRRLARTWWQSRLSSPAVRHSVDRHRLSCSIQSTDTASLAAPAGYRFPASSAEWQSWALTGSPGRQLW
eukprot:scpid64756/ scgid14169/ 